MLDPWDFLSAARNLSWALSFLWKALHWIRLRIRKTAEVQVTVLRRCLGVTLPPAEVRLVGSLSARIIRANGAVEELGILR